MRALVKYLLLLLLFSTLTIFLTYPLAFKMTDHIRSPGDGLFITWNLAWNVHILQTNPQKFFEANIFYPQKHVLALSDTLATETLLAYPVILLTDNPVLASNLLVITSYILSGFFMYLLARQVTKSEAGALVAGTIYVFMSYRTAHSVHINSLQTQWIPLTLLFLDLFWETKAKKYLFLFGSAYLLNFHARWDYAFFLTFFIAGYVGIKVIQERKGSLWQRGQQFFPEMVKIFCAMFLGILLTLPLILPTIRLHLEQPTFVRGLEANVWYAADLLDYLTVVTVPHNWFYQLIPIIKKGQLEHALFPGFATLLLGVVAARKLRSSKKAVNFYLALAFIFFFLSLGPLLKICGQILPIPLPYGVLFILFPPLRGLRVPSRLGLFVILCLAVLAAFGVQHLLEKIKAAWRRWLLLSAIIVFVLFESAAFPWPLAEVRKKKDFPAVYHWLAQQSGDFPVVELPLFDNFDELSEPLGGIIERQEDLTPKTGLQSYETFRIYYSTLHWKQLVNGYSSFLPETYAKAVDLFSQFPDQPSLDYGRELGLKYFLVHTAEIPEWEEILKKISQLPELHLVTAFDRDLVYELRREND